MPVRIKLLGVPHIRVDSEDVKLPNRRVTLSLLAYLVLHRGEQLARSHVAFALWPDEEEERALSELRRYLYKLRKLLPGDGAAFLSVDDDTISWKASAPCELDIVEFERLADAGKLTDAIALYDGGLLEEIYDDWVIAERERLNGRFLSAIWSSLVAARSRRAFPEAIALAQRLLAADPWREDAIRQLMALRYEAGDAAGALASYDRFARALRGEMNVDPMPETLALREAIMRGAPVPQKNDGAERPEPGKVADPFALPFVGRKREAETLEACWLEAARGHGSMTLVVGEAGIGKSRLVSELALKADAQGGRVLAGATTSPEYRPFQAIVDALRGAVPLLAAIDLAPPSLAALAELLPELRARRQTLPQLERLEPMAERSRLFDAIAQVLVALARPRPVLLVLEDLHWAGAVTHEMLNVLAPRIANAAVCVVVTAREEEATRAHPLRDLERSLRGTAAVSRLALGPLDREAVGALVDAVAADGVARDDIADAIFARSEGNALFATEMLRGAPGGLEHLSVPDSIRAMIEERAAQLAPATRAFVDVAAIIGAAFDLDLVCDVGGISLRDAEAALDELLERHVVRELARRNRNDFAFTHQLVHATLYDGVAGDVRERRHRRVARALDNVAEPERNEVAAEVAYHYERGGDPSAAASAYLRATRHAESVFANGEARAWSERGLALAAPGDPLRFELLLAHADVAARTGDRAAHKADLAQLREIARELGDEALCTVLEREIDGAYRADDRLSELAAIDELAKIAEKSGHAGWQAFVVQSRGRHVLALSDGVAALAHALDAHDRYTALGDERGITRALVLAATASAETGDTASALRYATHARERAERLGDAGLRMSALRMEGRAAQARQDGKRLAETALAVLAVCRATGDRDAEAHAHYQFASACWSLWRPDEGVSHFRSAVALFEALESTRVATGRVNLAGFLLDLGRFDEARALLDDAIEGARKSALAETEHHAACNLVELAWITGDAPSARRWADRALEVQKHLHSRRYDATAHMALGRALLCAGAFADALREFENVADVWLDISRYVDLIDVLLESALAQSASGDRRASLETLARIRAIESEQRAGSQYPIRAFWTIACVQKAAGDDAAARAALDAGAHALAERSAAVGDPELRDAFASIPYHRALGEAREHDRWPSFDRCAVAYALQRDERQPVQARRKR